VSSVLLLVCAGWLYLNRDYVIDSVTAWQYTPSPAISQLAERTHLTDLGLHYFYASRPEVNERAAFNTHCTVRGEKTVVLGCYSARRIYLFDVTDERLDGIKEVTAAHEMLHAAYDRLSDSEKERINTLISEWYPKITDERIKGIIAEYDKTEPGERLNELHSILPTEIATLSPELEQYYQQYFTDRAKVVAYSASYEQVFADISSQQKSLSEDLAQLAARISEAVTAYNGAITRLNADVAAFNTKAKSAGAFASQREFNAARTSLLDRQTVVSAQRTDVNAMIADYNAKRKQLEALNGQAESLNKSIDSLAPVPSI
jgi:hypothetical protein